MTNKELLQLICESVNIERPESLAALTWEQDYILQSLDEAHRDLCGMKDWWWLQRVGGFETWNDVNGATGGVTDGSPPELAVGLLNAFRVGLCANGKMQIGDVGTDRAKDIVRITATDTQIADVVSQWNRGTISAQDWAAGFDWYALATDVERVSWVITWRDTDSTIKHTVLEPATIDEIESYRANRSSYLYADRPLSYCVVDHGLTGDHIRGIVLDPFPDNKAHMMFGYMVKPAVLYGATEVHLNAPEELHEYLIHECAFRYFSTLGIGAPADSAAGRDLERRLVEAKQERDAILAELMGDTYIAQEKAVFSPEGNERIFFHEELGRGI